MVSFADVLTFTRGCAALLDEHRVPPGGRVAVVLHNSSLAALLFLGIIAAQRMLVPLNPKSGPAELDTLLAHADVALVLGPSSTAAKASPGRRWLTVDDAEAFLTEVLGRGVAHRGELVAPADGGAGDAEIVYTSGLDRRGQGCRAVPPRPARQLAGHGQVGRRGPRRRLPQRHSHAARRWAGPAHADAAVVRGRTVCVRSEVALARFWTYVDRFRPHLDADGQRLPRAPVERPNGRASRLKGVLAGGSALSPELIHRFESTFGIPVSRSTA